MPTTPVLTASDKRLRELNQDLDIEARSLIRTYEAHRLNPRGPLAIEAHRRLTIFVRRYGSITDGQVHYCYATESDSVRRAPARKSGGKSVVYQKIYRTHLNGDDGRLPGQRG